MPVMVLGEETRRSVATSELMYIIWSDFSEEKMEFWGSGSTYRQFLMGGESRLNVDGSKSPTGAARMSQSNVRHDSRTFSTVLDLLSRSILICLNETITRRSRGGYDEERNVPNVSNIDRTSLVGSYVLIVFVLGIPFFEVEPTLKRT